MAYPGPWSPSMWVSATPSSNPGCPTSSYRHPGHCPHAALNQVTTPRHMPFGVPYATPWHGHRGPHHPFRDKDDPWSAAVRECLNECPNKHLHYRRHEQGPTD